MILVAGAPHSGTSLVAGTLHKLGVFMGDKWLTVGTYEDAEFAAVETERQFIDLVLDRNSKHDMWGVKYPPLYKFLWGTSYLFSSMKIVYCYRNILSIKKRYGSDAIVRHLQYCGFWGAYLMTYNYPVLWMDYDDNIKNSKAMLENIIAFLGVNVADADKENALLFNNGGIGYENSLNKH